MGVLDFVLLLIFWFVVNATPGLTQAVGFVFGLVFAYWAFDEYFPGNQGR